MRTPMRLPAILLPGTAGAGPVPRLLQLAGRSAERNRLLAPCASQRSNSTLDRAPEQQLRAGNNGSSRSTSQGTNASSAGTAAQQHAQRNGSSQPGLEASQAPAAELRRGGYIQELYIRDFALVEEQRVRLQPGLTVVTGESGAGKSVLVAALGQILGATAPDNCIRQPASMAVVEGRLASIRALLGELGVPHKALPRLDLGAAALSLRREISSGGRSGSVRSRSYINGAPVSQRVLREVGSALVDVNGQHAAQTLRDPGAQLALLDRLAGTGAEAAAFSQAAGRLRTAEAELAALRELGDEGLREELQAMADEVAAACLEPGEERRLRARLRLLEARRGSVQRCALVGAAISGSDGGVDSVLSGLEADLRAVLSQEQAQAEVPEDSEEAAVGGATDEGPPPSEAIEAALEQLAGARRCLAAAEAEVESYARSVRLSEQEAEDVTARLAAVTKLIRRHGCRSSEELLGAAEKAAADLDRWYTAQGSREQLESEIEASRAALAAAAGKLSAARRAAAGKLRGAVERSLADLAMAGCRFDVRIGWDPATNSEGLAVPAEAAAAACELAGRFRLRPEGLDRAEFLLAAGEAEPLRPLGAVASGGERARVMLALKAAPAAASMAPEAGLGEAGGAPVLVLDELDAGVGGRLGHPVGRLLARMASAEAQGPVQILCVSHLPQVAASAEHHLCVRKAASADGRVTSRFASLAPGPERLAEIAAMGGVRQEEAAAMLAAASAAS